MARDEPAAPREPLDYADALDRLDRCRTDADFDALLATARRRNGQDWVIRSGLGGSVEMTRQVRAAIRAGLAGSAPS